jgi:hypothetical protein
MARRELVGGRLDALERALEEPTAAHRCLSEIDGFGRPGYFLLPSPLVSTGAFPVCSDATYMATRNGHAIFSYRRPTASAGLMPTP